MRCKWIRLAVLGVLLSCAAGLLLWPPDTGDALAAGASSTAPVPHSTGTLPTPAADAIPIDLGKPPAEPGASPAAPNLQLVYRVVWLPSGVTEKIYRPRQMVKGGVPPYNLSVVDGKLPPGLVLTSEGYLVGTPTSVGSYSFTLRVSDAAQVIQAQRYAVRVNAAKPKLTEPPKQAGSRKPPEQPQPPKPLVITWEEADTVVNLDSSPVMYKLTPEKLDKMLSGIAVSAPPASEDGASAKAEAEKQQQEIFAAKLRAVVAPLIDVEYPTRTLFESALDAGRCAYYRGRMEQLAEKKGVAADPRCPPAALDKPGAPGELTPNEFYGELLPADIRTDLIEAAKTLHPLVGGPKLEPPTGASLKEDGKQEGCGCAPQGTKDQIYGFYPFWDATEPRQPVDFGLFTRIGYMGVVLKPSGEFKEPDGWPGWTRGFTHTARRYGTRVDLVVYGRDWGWLPKSDAETEEVAQRAARNAVGMANVPEDASPRPFWLESNHAYDGITVFFEDPGTDAPLDVKASFARFLDRFIKFTIAAMQRSDRSYFLNIVVPENRVGEPGRANGKELSPYSFERLIGYIEYDQQIALDETTTDANKTEKGGATSGKADEKAPKVNNVMCAEETDKAGQHDRERITVKLLVLLGEPTTRQKKQLRSTIDGLKPPYDGHCRVKFLNSVIPVMFFRDPRGGAQQAAPAALDYGRASQFDKDLAYFRQTYNGVGFWPVPLATAGGTDSAMVLARLRENFEKVLREQSNPPPESADPLCKFVCPNRRLVWGIFRILLLVGVVSIGGYLLLCRVQRWAQRFSLPYYFLFVVAGGVVTALTGAALLNCDPTLGEMRAGNTLLYAVGSLLLLGCFYLILKPRVEPP